MTIPKHTTRRVSATEAVRLMGYDPEEPGTIRPAILLDMGGPRPLRRLATYRRRDERLRATCAEITHGTAHFVGGTFTHVVFEPAKDHHGTKPHRNPSRRKDAGPGPDDAVIEPAKDPAKNAEIDT